jgi:hypothetical protein
MKRFILAASLALPLIGSSAQAEIIVNARGENGWDSTDTRVLGVNATTAVTIDSRIQFSTGPAGSDGSVNLIAPTGTDKATIAYVDTNGLGGLSGLTGSYRWYKDGPVGAPAPALKLGLQTSDYGSVGSSTRIGENNWDKVLIYEPYDNPDAGSTPTGTWVTQTFGPNTGTWWMFNRNIGAGVNPPHANFTINDWLSDATYGTRLSGATIVDVQLGVGSSNADSNGFVDWLEISAIAGGERINFVSVPEPATVLLSGLAAIGFIGLSRRRRMPA